MCIQNTLLAKKLLTDVRVAFILPCKSCRRNNNCWGPTSIPSPYTTNTTVTLITHKLTSCSPPFSADKLCTALYVKMVNTLKPNGLSKYVTDYKTRYPHLQNGCSIALTLPLVPLTFSLSSEAVKSYKVVHTCIGGKGTATQICFYLLQQNSISWLFFIETKTFLRISEA